MTQPFNDRGPFAVGEICYVVDASNPIYNGCECRVLAVEVFGLSTLYEIDIANPAGGNWRSEEKNLRRLRPPESDDATACQAMLDCIERAKQPVSVDA